MLYERAIKQHIITAMRNYPAVVITKARQVGKSTLVYEFVKEQNFAYVSLDSIQQRNLAIQDPHFLFQQFSFPLIIDEVQYAPVLFEVIEEIVNQKRLEAGSANGMFLLIGSQVFHLMNQTTQSLAGRVSIIQMQPLSLNELYHRITTPFLPDKKRVSIRTDQKLQVKELFELITKGMYPALHREEKDIADFYENYVTTYIDRDISELIHLRDRMKFHQFLQYLTVLTTQQVNVADLSRRIAVTSNTVNHWLSILETSGLIYFVQPYYDASITKRVVRSSKMYFSDTGLAAYPIRLNHAETLRISNFSGAFFETFVMNEIRKSFLNSKQPFPVYYYRDNKQNEVDCVIVYQGKLSLIEIKQGVNYRISDVKGFKQLEHSVYVIENQAIVCNTQELYALSKDVRVVPMFVI